MKALLKHSSPEQESNCFDRPASVSTFSSWNDLTWWLPPTTDGQSRTVTEMKWDFTVGRDDQFSGSNWDSLRECLKLLLWWLLTDPLSGRFLKETSLGRFSSSSRCLVRWMATRNLFTLAQLTPEICAEYVEDAAAAKLAEGITRGGLYHKYRILEWIYLHTHHFKKAGMPHMPTAPFHNTANWLAKRLSEKPDLRTSPFPDEVAILLMNEALRMIGTPADDVIKLQEAVIHAVDHLSLVRPIHTAQQKRYAAIRAVASDFRFSTLPGESAPWHPPIDNVGGSGGYQTPVRICNTTNFVVRNLIRSVVEAAVITIQSQTGIRSNELCGLESGPSKNGLPHSITKKLSNSGVSEIFYLNGWLAKTRKGKQPVEWAVGLRPRGSNYIPPVVRAVIVLESILRPWRTRTSHLLLFPKNSGVLHNPEHIKPALTSQVRHALQHFGDRCLQTQFKTIESEPRLQPYLQRRFRNAKPQQWRPTWAHFVFKVNSSMLPDISRHFKHLSLAMTEQGYLGNDPSLLETLDEHRLQETVRFFFEASQGVNPVIGGAAGMIRDIRESSKIPVRPRTSNGERLRQLTKWVSNHDLRIWFLDEGKCLINLRPMDAQCHVRAGTAHWSNDRPNYVSRSPDVCLSCRCFATDLQHVDFWQKRFSLNTSAFETAKALGREDEFAVAEARAKQAATILAALAK